MGNPSGTEATASATPVCTMPTMSEPRRMPPPIANAARVSDSHTSRCPSRSSRFSSAVTSALALPARSLMRPIPVPMPVATATPRPDPCVIAVPLKTMLQRSPTSVSASSGSVDFSTGVDSPVSTASSTCRPATSISLRPAVTMSPASRTTRSPGAMSRCATTSSTDSAKGGVSVSSANRAALRCQSSASSADPVERRASDFRLRRWNTPRPTTISTDTESSRTG